MTNEKPDINYTRNTYSFPFENIYELCLATECGDSVENRVYFKTPDGIPVLAALGGIVIHHETNHSGIKSRSNHIIIQHRHGEHSEYRNLQASTATVTEQQEVKQGDVLAFTAGKLEFGVFVFARGTEDKIYLPVRFLDENTHCDFSGEAFRKV